MASFINLYYLDQFSEISLQAIAYQAQPLIRAYCPGGRRVNHNRHAVGTLNLVSMLYRVPWVYQIAVRRYVSADKKVIRLTRQIGSLVIIRSEHSEANILHVMTTAQTRNQHLYSFYFLSDIFCLTRERPLLGRSSKRERIF